MAEKGVDVRWTMDNPSGTYWIDVSYFNGEVPETIDDMKDMVFDWIANETNWPNPNEEDLKELWELLNGKEQTDT